MKTMERAGLFGREPQVQQTIRKKLAKPKEHLIIVVLSLLNLCTESDAFGWQIGESVYSVHILHMRK